MDWLLTPEVERLTPDWDWTENCKILIKILLPSRSEIEIFMAEQGKNLALRPIIPDKLPYLGRIILFEDWN